MIFQNGETIVFAGDSVTDCGRKRPYGMGLWEGLGNGYVRMVDTSLAIDMGIAAQSILLTATELGLGGCMIRSFKRSEIDAILKKDGYNSAFVIALGKPTEKVYLTDVVDGDIKYFRDENDDHAVPKLSLDELII